MQAQNPIPLEFRTSSSAKYHVAKEELAEGRDSKRTKKAKENFLLESNFLVNQVLSSGRVLFNDPVSEYLGKVLDVVLADDTALRKTVRVYALRSTVVNSFTTDDGIILVNLGLLAQLENEAQLAYILCHELVHYTHNHVINAYVEDQELKYGKGEYLRNTFDERMLERSNYSKTLEKSADRIGLERFLRTPYSSKSVLNVFEVMRYAHLPFDDIPFDKTFFNSAYYKIDDSYFLNRVRPVEALESDENSTHPSPTERQQLMSRYLAKTVPTGIEYVVSQKQFEHLRETARFELSHLYLMSNEPVMSIYNDFMLLRSHPDNEYLRLNIAKALYTLSKFKTGGNYGLVHPGFSHIEGESQQLYHLFYRLKPEELSVLATRYVWKLKDEFPDNQDLVAMSDDLLTDLMMRYYLPGMFAEMRPAEGWDTPDTTQSFTGKYDRLKQKSKDNPRLTMIKYAVVDLFDNAEFAQRFDELARKRWIGNEEIPSSRDIRKQNKEDWRKWKNHGFAIGANKVAVVSPVYSKLDLRKKQQHKFLHSESAKEKLLDKIERSAQLLNLDVEVLESSLLDSASADKFNDISFLNEWVDHRFSQLDVGMININQDQIDGLVEKYGTEYFSWTGVINYRENKPLLYFYLLYALIPPAIPFAIYYLARPNYDTYYYCITFNLTTGEPVMVSYNNFRNRDARDMINSNVYDSFWQMKRKPRKKG